MVTGMGTRPRLNLQYAASGERVCARLDPMLRPSACRPFRSTLRSRTRRSHVRCPRSPTARRSRSRRSLQNCRPHAASAWQSPLPKPPDRQQGRKVRGHRPEVHPARTRQIYRGALRREHMRRRTPAGVECLPPPPKRLPVPHFHRGSLSSEPRSTPTSADHRRPWRRQSGWHSQRIPWGQDTFHRHRCRDILGRWPPTPQSGSPGCVR